MLHKEVDITTDKRTFWTSVKKQFVKNKLAVISLYFIFFLALIALFADYIANEKPLYAVYQGKAYFPISQSYLVDLKLAKWPKEFQNKEWLDIEFDLAIWPPLPYLPQNIDFDNAQSIGPLDKQIIKTMHLRHWLGTDELGHDILSGMIHGTRIALSVGLISVGISAFLGIILGSMAGYFGDERLKVSRIRIILNIIFLFLGIFYAFGTRSFIISDALGDSFFFFLVELGISILIILMFILVANVAASLLKLNSTLKKKVKIPVDIMISRLIEVIVSIPQILLIVSIVAIAKPSIFIVMTIIGLTTWTGIARFIRGELLRVRNLEFVEAAQALGFPEWRIIFKHAIPNALSPVLIAVAFGIAAAVLIESSLSFLGIGVPAETMTWGSLLAAARQSPSAWWLAIFPGFAIFITVTAFNLIGEGLTDALDPRLKQ